MENNTLWKFIDEQPKVLQSILETEQKITAIADSQVDTIIITASGTSLNAAIVLKPFFNQICDCNIIIENPFQLRYYHSILNTKQYNTIVIGISQTGKSTGTIDCIKMANTNKIPTIALTDAYDSPLAKEANYIVGMGCGEEDVPPKTKGFSATVLSLQLLVMQLLHVQQKDIIEEYKKHISNIENTIAISKQWASNHSFWSKAPTITTVGFGYNDGIAKEGSLKLLETLQIPVMNYDLEEFMHGPHRTIVKDSFIILIQTQGNGDTFMNNLIEFVKSKTTNYLVISTTNPPDEHTISIPEMPLTGSWMHTMIPFQVLCSYLPEVNGVNPANPVYASFATTVGTRTV